MTSVQSPRQPIVNAPPVTFALCLALCGLWGFFQLAPEEWTYVVLARLSLFPPDFLAVASGAAGMDTVPILATLLTHALVHVVPNYWPAISRADIEGALTHYARAMAPA